MSGNSHREGFLRLERLMARHAGGWFKIHRKVFLNWIGQDAASLSILTVLIAWANTKQSSGTLRGQLLPLERGQLATSPSEIAAQLKLDVKLVARRLDMFSSEGIIVQQKTKRGRVITICNYEKYQESNRERVEQMSDRSPTDVQQTSNRCPLREEDKELSYGEKKRKKTPQRAGGRAHAHNDRGSDEGGWAELELRAQGILNRAIGAMRDHLSPDEAIAYLGEGGWAVLRVRYPTWPAFVDAYAQAYKGSSPTIAEGQFRKMILAELLTASGMH